MDQLTPASPTAPVILCSSAAGLTLARNCCHAD